MEPLNAVALAIVPKKRLTSRRSVSESYTCDSSPGEDAAAGENADVASASKVRFPGSGGW